MAHIPTRFDSSYWPHKGRSRQRRGSWAHWIGGISPAPTPWSVSGAAWDPPTFLPSPDDRPLLMAGRGVAASVGIIAAGDAQTPDVSDGFLISVWRCIPTGGSEGSLPVQGRSNRVCPSVLAPPNSGVESHRPVRVLDDVGGGLSAGQELHPTNSDAVADRTVVQSLQSRRGVVARFAVGMTDIAVAPAGGIIATSDCVGQASTTVAVGRFECWVVLKIATRSYGQRLFFQSNRAKFEPETTESTLVRL